MQVEEYSGDIRKACPGIKFKLDSARVPAPRRDWGHVPLSPSLAAGSPSTEPILKSVAFRARPSELVPRAVRRPPNATLSRITHHTPRVHLLFTNRGIVDLTVTETLLVSIGILMRQSTNTKTRMQSYTKQCLKNI